MKIVNLAIEDIKEYENNPRNNDAAVGPLAEAIKQFGFKVPIIVDEKRIIVSGHTRLKAAKQLKMDEVPVIIADDLSPEQIKAFRLADNKVSEIAEWNEELLEKELIELQNMDINFSMLDFGFDDFEELFEEEVIDDEYEIQLPEKPEAKLGQIFRLGNHRLMCGDATNAEDVRKLMNGEQLQLIVTDPPYNVAYEGKTEKALTIENDDMSNEQFYIFLKTMFDNYFEHTEAGAGIYVFHAASEVLNFLHSYIDSGFLYKQMISWVKNAFVLGRQDYHWQHEPCNIWVETRSCTQMAWRQKANNCVGSKPATKK